MSFFSTLFAAATFVAAAYLTSGMSIGYQMAATFAASMIVSRLFAPNQQSPQTQGNNTRQQVPPDPTAGIPLVYGSAYTSGRFVDGILTNDQQSMYYTMVISCISTNGQFTYDTTKFYYQDQLIAFDGTDQTKVVSLTDGAGNVDNTISGHLYIWLYTSSPTGTITPINSSQLPSDVLTAANGIPTAQVWSTSNRQMNGTAFAIARLVYNSGSAGTTSLQPVTFHVTHALNGTGVAKPGDVWYDYLTNAVYGGAVPTANVDSAAATALNTYSDATINYTPYGGGSASQPRYRFNGVLDTGQTILSNIDLIMNCCDCWQGYQSATGLWTVIINQDIASSFDFDDTNIIGGINVGSLDITQQSNQIEAKFNDSTNRDQAGYVNIQTPSGLLYPNEPVNKYSVSYDLVNDSVMAQYLANRTLEQARLDLVVNFSTTYAGIQVNAGDVITITNDDYGWSAKKFRVMQVKEASLPDGNLGASIQCLSYDSAVYATASITQYTPTPNSNLANPNTFGTVGAPTISNLQTIAAVPSFQVNINASSLGITEYAEVWYSPYPSASPSQLIFYGTTEVMQGGSAYPPATALPPVTVTGLAPSDWYFYTRMVNSLTKSQFSAASSVVNWRPMTFQFTQRYLSVAYGTSSSGAGFSFSPVGCTYFGLSNRSTPTVSSTPSDYTWYLANPAFGTTNYLLFTNRSNNLMSFSVGAAQYSAGTALFVPSDTTIYDQTIWQALPYSDNLLDLNQRTGQLLQTGTTTVGTGEILVSNNPQGQVVASLAQLLTFPGGAYTKTSSVATLTVDIYGRVVGFSAPDAFYYSMTAFTASSGQTSFSVTRGSEYITGNCWVLENGLLLDTSEYTDAAGSVTLGTGATAGNIVTIISFASVNSSTSATYNSFSRNTVSLSNQASYIASGFTINSGSELLFINGTVVNAQDYNISGQTITFVNAVSGDLQVIQWANNNLGVPNGTPVNVDAYTVIGQTVYPFTYDPNAFNLWNNGALLLETVDYTVATGTYTLSQTPTTTTNILVQQTFSRTGAV